MRNMGAPPGISWIELLICLLVLAVLAALGAPMFLERQDEGRVAAAASTLMATVHLARSEALLRNQPTVLCLSHDGQRCLESRGTAHGWLLFVDVARGRNPQRDARDPLLRVGPPDPRILLHGTRAAITYWPTPTAGTTATLTICASHGRARPRALVISQTGRPRLRRLPIPRDGCAT